MDKGPQPASPQQNPVSAEASWRVVLGQLQYTLGHAQFNANLIGATVGVNNGQLTIFVDNEMIVERLQHQAIGQRIIEAVTTEFGPADVVFAVREKKPGPSEIDINLIYYNPTERGFVMTPHYAIRFWQPYLTLLPFSLYQTIRSFGWREGNEAWPSIQTLAHTVANGDRHKILGRNARQGRQPVKGALTVLQEAAIVSVITTGKGWETRYTFNVLDALPLLTPTQVATLPPKLQTSHYRFLQNCKLDYNKWQQITVPSLTLEAMSGTDPMSGT